MANKKKIEERQHMLQKQRTERMIQVGGGVLLVLIVIGIIWLVFTRKPTAATPAEATVVPTEVSNTSNAASTPETSSNPTEASSSSNTPKQYSAYPAMSIDVNKQYFATFKMAKGGEFKVQLFPDKAPKTVNSFVFLARDHYFDGVTFHRVLEGFMAQGGDPTGTGMGGPGYQFENEDSDLTFDKPGVVAMANAGRDTNGSQFFITFVPVPQLNGGYTIFGQVVEGMDVVNGITRRDPDQGPTFEGDAIQTIEIAEQ